MVLDILQWSIVILTGLAVVDCSGTALFRHHTPQRGTGLIYNANTNNVYGTSIGRMLLLKTKL